MDTNESEYKIFAHNIAWLRKHYSLSKKKMAELLGISLFSINKIEKGEIPPRMGINVFFAVQKAFKLSPSAQLTQWLED